MTKFLIYGCTWIIKEIMELKKEDIIEVTIESTGFEGKSVARVDGMVVFVEGAIAGDVVKAKIYKTKKKYAEAKLVEVVTPSAQRTTARCSYFGVCGGCKWQHVDYPTQLQYKQQHVADALEHIGGFKQLNILPIVGSDEIFYYRNKLEFSFSDKRWLTEKAHQPWKIMTDYAHGGYAKTNEQLNDLSLIHI